MKKVMAGVLAIVLTFSGVALPNNLFETRGSIIVASAETWSTAKTLTADTTVSGDLIVSDTLKLNGHKLTVTGNMYMTKGELNIGSGSLVVNGNLKFSTTDNASVKSYMVMQNSSGSVTIGKDFGWTVSADMTNSYSHTISDLQTSGLITAGTIYLKGNFADNTYDKNSFVMEGTSKLVFNGSADQSYRTTNSQYYKGGLNDISVSGSQSIVVYYYLFAQKLLSDINIKEGKSFQGSFDINGHTVNVDGNMMQQEQPLKNAVNGNNLGVRLSGGKLNVSGNYVVYSSDLSLGGGTMTVGKDFLMGIKSTTTGKYSPVTASLTMNNSKDVLIVAGSYADYSNKYNDAKNTSVVHSTKLSNGKLYVGGDFTCGSSDTVFSSPHTTILNGTGDVQKITMANGKKFYNLELTRVNSYYDPSNLTNYVAGTLKSQTVPLTGASVTASNCTYNGSAQTPAVTVKVGSTTLKSGTDYTVSYSNNTNAGTATITVTGKGSYSGTASGTFTINAKGISGASLSQTSFTYDGSAKKPAVKDGSKTLTENTDYTVTSGSISNTNAGTYSFTIKGKGNYSGTKELTYTIAKQQTSISNATVTAAACTYDGSAKQPAITVKLGSTTLSASSDYTVSYGSSNVNAGQCSFTVTGKGSYTGSVSGTFTISPKSVSNVTISPTSYTYDGSAKKPSVYDGTKKLTEGTDYNATYTNNVNAGTATINISGKGNYTGSKSLTYTIASTTTSISGASVSAAACTYDGTAKQPAITVTVGGKTLTSGTDYTVSYGSNNVNAGQCSFTVTGKGSYTGTKSGTFTISPKSVSGVSLSQTSFSYDGSAKKPAVKDGSKTLTENTDYKITSGSISNTNAGTYTVTVTGNGNYTGSKSLTYTITNTQTNISNAVIKAAACTYSGSEQKPTLTVTVNGKPLTAGTDYQITGYTNNISAGSTAKVSIKGIGNYTGTASETFTISPKSVANVTITPTSFTANGTAQKPAVYDGSKKLTEGTDYTAAYSNNVNAGTATIKITGKGNYTGEATRTYTISSNTVDISKANVQASDCTYSGSALRPAVTVTVNGKKLTENTDYTVSYSNNINAGTATVTVTAKGGSYTGTATGSFNIAPRSVKGNVTLSPSSFPYDGTAKKPDVYDGTKKLTYNDFNATYSNNVNVGTATAVIKGKGNYTGETTLTYQITSTKVNISNANVSVSACTYNGTAQVPAFTVSINGNNLTKGTDYNVTCTNNTNAGTASYTITGKGNYEGTKTGTFTINKKSVSGCSLAATSVVYNGAAQEPAVIEVTSTETRVLKRDTDYTVTFSNNVNEGTATAVITGKNNYTGTKTLTFTITKNRIELSNANTSIKAATTCTYNGSAQQPTLIVSVGGNILTAGTDYVVTGYSNNINAGMANVNIEGRGDYKGMASGSFTITAKSVAGLSLAETTVTYDGKSKTPAVMDASKQLKENVDYTASWSNNVDAGTARVTVTGMGNYQGSVTLSFEIKKNVKDISSATISASACTYDGTAKTPAVTVVHSGKTLKEGTDFVVSYYDNNINAGTANVGIVGKGDYSGSAAGTFKITPKSVSGIILEQTVFAYDGNEKKPGVRDGSKLLTEGVDYTASYTGNKNAGTASVTVSGKGNYTGSKSLTYTIVKNTVDIVDISGCSVDSIIAETYDGTAKTPDVRVHRGTEYLTEGTDYTLSYSNNTDAGYASVTISGKGKYGGTRIVNFIILPKDISTMTFSVNPTTVEYDGTAKTPEPVVTDGSKTLVNNKDYTVSYYNNINTGTATATVTGTGNYTGRLTTEFTVKSPKVSVEACSVVLSCTSYNYDGTAKVPNVKVLDGETVLTQDVDYKLDISSNIEVGTAVVTITGCGEYTGIREEFFTIDKAAFDQFDISLSYDSCEYDGAAKKPVVTVKDDEGRSLSEKYDYEVEYYDNILAGQARVVISASPDGNYSGSVEKKFTIEKGDVTTSTITLSEYSFTADGRAKKPSVNVEKGGRTLVEGRDYKAVYTDNIEAGIAYVTVDCSSSGNYKGSVEIPFAISSPDAQSISDFTVTADPAEFDFDGTEKKPALTVKDTSGNVLTEGTDFITAYPNCRDAGTAVVYISGLGKYKDTITAEYEIKPVSIENAQLTLGSNSYVYDGTVKKPAVFVTLGEDNKLMAGRDFEVEYTDNTNAGTAKVTVKGINNYTGTLSTEFTIGCRSVENLLISLENTEFEFDNSEIVPNVTVTDHGKTLKAGVDYEIEFIDNDRPGTATVKITGIGCYSGEATGSFIIKEKPEPETDPTNVNKGDVNGDGKINAVDITKIAAHIKGLKKLTTEEMLFAADVDDDGRINSADITRIAAHIKGLKNIK